MKSILRLAFVLSLIAKSASAQLCGPLPNILTNGTTADATQVMADFNTLLTCINNDGKVNAGTAGQIAYYSASGSTVSGTTLSSLLDSAFGSSRGLILYRGAAGWAALAPGTVGYVLQTGGTSGDPSWSPAGGGGAGISTIVGSGVSSTASTVGLPMPVISRPTLASMTWVNQSGATATDNTNGPLVLRATGNTGGNNINALVKNVAGTSWTVTIEYALGNHIAGTNVDLAGLVVQNSSTGQLYVCGLVPTGIQVWQYSSPTSWNASQTAKTILSSPTVIWTRAQYVSSTTTLIFSYSIDGFTWEPIYSTNTPYVGVPTGYGIAVGQQGNTAGYVLSLNYLGESSP